MSVSPERKTFLSRSIRSIRVYPLDAAQKCFVPTRHLTRGYWKDKRHLNSIITLFGRCCGRFCTFPFLETYSQNCIPVAEQYNVTLVTECAFGASPSAGIAMCRSRNSPSLFIPERFGGKHPRRRPRRVE